MNNLVFLDFKVTIRTPLLQVLKLQKNPLYSTFVYSTFWGKPFPVYIVANIQNTVYITGILISIVKSGAERH